jgi:hypothetical protein
MWKIQGALYSGKVKIGQQINIRLANFPDRVWHS